MPNKIVIIRDSTQITDFLICQQYWQYRHQERLQPIRAAGAGGSDAKMMGTYGHLLLEEYYRSRAEGDTVQKAMESALELNVDNLKCECGLDYGAHDGQNEGLPNDCQVWKPKKLDLDQPSRLRVQERLKAYWYTRSLGHDFMPNSPDSIEVGFSELIYEDCERMYILEGRIDLLATLVGTPCIVDHKFQLRRKSLYTRAIQCRNYAMVTGRPLFIYNMIRLADKVDGQTFERPIGSFTTEYLKWWRLRLVEIFHKMYLAEVEGDGYERNESMCTNKYGYECEYTPLCDEINPEIRESQKSLLYTIGEVWKPW